MSAQTPFDQAASYLEIHKVTKNEVDFAGVYFVKPDAPLDMDNPMAITVIGGPAERLPENTKDLQMLRLEFEWLVGGCAAFHDVEVRNFIDDASNPVVTPRRSTFGAPRG